jgi:hypothetical protein
VYGWGDGINVSGVTGESTKFHGVYGVGHDVNNSGVFGTNDAGGAGVHGAGRQGVVGTSTEFQGVYGWGDGINVAGVVGESPKFHGVFGISHDVNNAGVFGTNDAGGPAGRFDGDVEVTGDVRLTNADCAEDFDIAQSVSAEPGTVMVLEDEGTLRPCWRPYDKRAAGVVSGAGGYRPGIILDSHGTHPSRKPVALLGKAFCKVDAGHGAVEVGDLLTTSSTPGHAMRVSDPQKAFGAVIGKALRALPDGCGQIPILIALQ